jgi:hypothetical protein
MTLVAVHSVLTRAGSLTDFCATAYSFHVNQSIRVFEAMSNACPCCFYCPWCCHYGSAIGGAVCEREERMS